MLSHICLFLLVIICCSFSINQWDQCQLKAKQAWGVGRMISEADFRRLKILPQKVRQTAIIALSLCERGYSVDAATALAKKQVELSLREHKTRFFQPSKSPSLVQKGFEINIFSKDF